MRIIFAAFLLFCISACESGQKSAEEPRTQEQIGTEEYGVVKLFAIEGCNVYRFNPGSYHYVTICPHQTTTAWQKSGDHGAGHIEEVQSTTRP